MGHVRFPLFYLLCGVLAGLAHVWVDPASPVPAIGASGAIAGVLGAYLTQFPGARVLTFIPIFIVPWLINVPAILWLGGWFVSQLVSGVATISDEAQAMGGVGYWAHIGGFVAGVVLIWPFRRRRASWR